LNDDNLGRVAASAEDINAVLKKEAGLMVELKRWIANNSSNHGQVVEDKDLTDQAITEKIISDSEFRAVATRLLQRYGYLLPRLNPGSEADFQDQLRRLAMQRQSAQPQYDRAAGTNGAEPQLAGQQKTRATEQGRPAAGGGLPLDNPGSSMTVPALPPLSSERTENQPNDVLPGLVRTSARQSDSAQTNTQADGSNFTRMDASSSDATAAEGTRSAAIGSGNSSGFVDAERASMNRELTERASAPLAPNRDSSPSTNNPIVPASRAGGFEPNEKTNRERSEYEESEIFAAERPVILRQPNPFSDVPSLYDLYQKISSRPPELKRFGADVFRLKGEDTSQLPMDLPAGADYVVGPGDGLEIDLWGGASERVYRVVDREGRISLPEVGPLLVSGRALGDVQQAVQHSLRTQFRDVSADVSLARLRSVRVYVVGEVENPGPYDISSLSTPLNALVSAGGATPHGSLRRVRHFRGNQLIQEVDIYDLLLRGVRGDVKRIESGDTLLIPPAGPEITVEGMVRRPAIYELRDESNLAQALALAGGILPAASLRHVEVERVEAHEKRTILSLDMSAENDAAAAKQLEAFAIHDGDHIRILSIAPSTQDAVYLQGHVLRAGRYSFQPGMRVTDLFSSYGDLMPEPDRYAEIIRLAAPDYRPAVESFDLSTALADPATAPRLQPLDTVRIFSRYDFVNAPAVNVGGEVRHPGDYRTTGQVHLRDAIHEAGGLTPDASLDAAQLIRYNPDSSLKITTVNLALALEGDPMHNLLLQPRDRLMIQRNPARVDPATVYIRGEVAQPGRFPLTANLCVSSLIQLSGGLKRSAFSETADLTRYSDSDQNKQVSRHFQIDLAKAMAGDPANDLGLRDGDVLSIGKLPGWGDRGASVTLTGEVTHPGTYGIKPGEHLSSVLLRAGGFLPTAHPAAAVFERNEVLEFQQKTRKELISRIRQQASNVNVAFTATAQEQADLSKAAFDQQQHVLAALEAAPVSGRMVVHVPRDLQKFVGSVDDIELRADDTLFIPKLPEFVVVSGQVYNSNALTFEPGKTVSWYVDRAGGPTKLADKGAIFVIRSDGSVISGRGSGWWGRNVESMRVEPGDSVIVPEKALGGSSVWKNLLGVAQIVESGSIASLAIKGGAL
jgi:protein involved in polysaccharide export with SLBB domain